jgi:hypothetical protein
MFTVIICHSIQPWPTTIRKVCDLGNCNSPFSTYINGRDDYGGPTQIRDWGMGDQVVLQLIGSGLWPCLFPWYVYHCLMVNFNWRKLVPNRVRDLEMVRSIPSPFCLILPHIVRHDELSHKRHRCPTDGPNVQLMKHDVKRFVDSRTRGTP